MSTPHPPAHRIALRVALALAGGYCFIRHLAAAAIAALVRLGTDYEPAWMLAIMSVFLVYLAVLLWAFADRSLMRVAVVLVGGTLLLAGLTHALVAHAAGR